MQIYLRDFTPQLIESTYLLIQNVNLRKMFCLNGEPDYSNNLNYFTNKLSDSTQKVWGIICDGKHIGNAGIKGISDESCEVWLYIASESFQGRGIGSIVMQSILKKVKELKISKVFLYVRADNLKAIKMYKKFGFSFAPNVSAFKSWGEENVEILYMEKELI